MLGLLKYDVKVLLALQQAMTGKDDFFNWLVNAGHGSVCSVTPSTVRMLRELGYSRTSIEPTSCSAWPAVKTRWPYPGLNR